MMDCDVVVDMSIAVFIGDGFFGRVVRARSVIV